MPIRSYIRSNLQKKIDGLFLPKKVRRAPSLGEVGKPSCLGKHIRAHQITSVISTFTFPPVPSVSKFLLLQPPGTGPLTARSLRGPSSEGLQQGLLNTLRKLEVCF